MNTPARVTLNVEVEMPTKDTAKLIPGTNIEYFGRKADGLSFLIEGEWPITLGAWAHAPLPVPELRRCLRAWR